MPLFPYVYPIHSSLVFLHHSRDAVPPNVRMRVNMLHVRCACYSCAFKCNGQWFIIYCLFVLPLLNNNNKIVDCARSRTNCEQINTATTCGDNLLRVFIEIKNRACIVEGP